MSLRGQRLLILLYLWGHLVNNTRYTHTHTQWGLSIDRHWNILTMYMISGSLCTKESKTCPI